MKSKSPLVVRHNGGAQSGHTVEIANKRFVFHELSSGSFRGAATYWADTFYPDMYKLREEIRQFYKISGDVPKLYSSKDACITTIDDVLINMMLESSRGSKRHGSCGMGINEADLRCKEGYRIAIGDIYDKAPEKIYSLLREVRFNYSHCHLQEYGLDKLCENEYYNMLLDDNVLFNYAKDIAANMKHVSLVSNEKELLSKYADIIFENGQGLLLDSENVDNQPHVTASRTGLTNVMDILNRCDMTLNKVAYVTRSYLTRHGAGPLKNENTSLAKHIVDNTNVYNPWQGQIRYASFEDVEAFMNAIYRDISQCQYNVSKALFVTHLNETDDNILFKNGSIKINHFAKMCKIKDFYDDVYISRSPYSEDIVMI